MDKMISAMTRIEQGLASPGDLELLMRFVRDSFRIDENDPFMTTRLFRLVQAITEIAAAHESDQIAHLTASRALEFFPGGACLLLQWDGKQFRLIRGSQENDPAWNEPFNWPDMLKFDEAPFLQPALEKQALVRCAAGDPAFDAFFEQTGVAGLAAVPVTAHHALLGLLLVLRRTESAPFRPVDEVFLRLLANGAGVSLDNALLYDAERQHSHELESLHRASLALTASLDLKQVLDAILQAIFNLLRDAKDAHIFLYNGEELHFGAALWWNGRRDQYTQPRKNGITYTVAVRGEPIVVTDMQDHELFHNAPTNWSGSIVGLPLKIGMRVVGVLNVARVETIGFTAGEMRLLRLLADQAAMAIENARLHNLILQQALTDTLTALPNRRSFDQRLNQEIRRAARYHHPFVLMMMDIDHFKQINDHFGHPAGDAALKQMAALLNQNLRDTDFLARYGGDEFALILPETNAEGAQRLIDNLHDRLENSLFSLTDGKVCTLSGSFGYALFPECASSSDELISIADQMLYESKHAATH